MIDTQQEQVMVVVKEKTTMDGARASARAHPYSSADIDAPKTKSHQHGWLFQFGVCRETTMLLRFTLILAAVLVAGSTSASIAAGAKRTEREKSYTRAPMRARSMAPRIESGAAATKNVKPFTIEEQRWFNQANGSRW